MQEQSGQAVDESKRDFLKIFLTGGVMAWAAAVLYPIFSYLKPPIQNEVAVTSVRVGKLADIQPESGTIVRFGDKPVILIRSADGKLHALSATCTHLDCTVQYRKDMGMIWCACHNGMYDLNGKVVSGPPPAPLEEYAVRVRGDEVVISRRA